MSILKRILIYEMVLFLVFNFTLLPNPAKAATSVSISEISLREEANGTFANFSIVWTDPPKGTITHEQLLANGTAVIDNSGSQIVNSEPNNLNFGYTFSKEGTYQFQAVFEVTTRSWTGKESTQTYKTNVVTKDIIGAKPLVDTYNIKSTSDAVAWWKKCEISNKPSDQIDPKEVGYIILGAKEILSDSKYSPESVANDVKVGEGPKGICDMSSLDTVNYLSAAGRGWLDLYKKVGGNDPAVLSAAESIIQQSNDVMAAVSKVESLTSSSGSSKCDAQCGSALGAAASIEPVKDTFQYTMCKAQCWLMNSLSGFIAWVIDNVLFPSLGICPSGKIPTMRGCEENSGSGSGGTSGGASNGGTGTSGANGGGSSGGGSNSTGVGDDGSSNGGGGF